MALENELNGVKGKTEFEVTTKRQHIFELWLNDSPESQADREQEMLDLAKPATRSKKYEKR